MNRAALIDQIRAGQRDSRKLLALLQSAPVERDRFVSHLYQSRRDYRRTCETAGKSGKQIERRVITSIPRSPRAWALRANFANRSTCSGSKIDCVSGESLTALLRDSNSLLGHGSILQLVVHCSQMPTMTSLLLNLTHTTETLIERNGQNHNSPQTRRRMVLSKVYGGPSGSINEGLGE